MTPTELHYEEVLADHRRLVRELDVLINGEGAAAQASLCDIVGQLQREQHLYKKGNPYFHPSRSPASPLLPAVSTVCSMGHTFYQESHVIIRCPYCADRTIELQARRIRGIKATLRALSEP